MELKLKHYYPLFMFIIPSIIISIVLFVVDYPGLTIVIGLVVLLIAACGTYYLGIRGVARES